MHLTGRLPLRDSHKAVLALLLPVTGILLALGLFYFFLTQTTAESTFTNLAGRQRMLSQQMLVTAHRVLLHHPEDRATLRALAADFEHNLQILETGGEVLGRELPPTPSEVQGSIASARALWHLGKPGLLRIADAPPGNTLRVSDLDQLDVFIKHLTAASDSVTVSYESWSQAERTRALFNLKLLLAFDLLLLVIGVFVVKRYLAGKKQADEALRRSEEDWRRTFDSIPDLISLHDRNFRIVRANQAMAQHFGMPAEELVGKPCYELFHGTDKPVANCPHARTMLTKQTISDEVDGAGTACPFQITTSPLLDMNNEVIASIHVARDITDRRRDEVNLEFLAHYDHLTHLPNRLLFLDRLNRMLASASRHQRQVAVLFLDLDRFKVINDTLDHDAGDLLLQAFAQRLKEEVHEDDTVSRFGGDEFAIALADIATEDDAIRVAENLLRLLSRPFVIRGRELFVTASIGMSIYPADAAEAKALVGNADATMHRAKALGKNTWQRYNPADHAEASRRLTLETDLRHALENGELSLHYQPKMNIATGLVCGAEALLRWQHPQLGLLQPLDFIPLLEETGLIVPVGAWVLRTACTQARAWQDAGLPFANMAINLSARQFQRQLAGTVAQALDDSGLPPQHLELEITENILMENSELSLAMLNELTARGVHLTIDDFGTGYSSLSYLTRFPVDSLKIDRSFMRDIASDSDDASIVQAVITMAHTLGLTVIAEGVETKQQLDFLRRNRCDEIQGYYVSRPLDSEAFTRLLEREQHYTMSLVPGTSMQGSRPGNGNSHGQAHS